MSKKTKKNKPIDFRKMILNWLGENGHNRYWLAKKCQQSGDFKKERYLDTRNAETGADGKVWRKRSVAVPTKDRPLAMTENTLFRYLRGERDITAEKLSQILHLMGAEVNA